MRLICCVIIFGILAVNSCGCENSARYKELDRRVNILLKNSIHSPINWELQAGFYESNYPELSQAERADMLIALLDSEKQKYYVEEKTITTIEKRVFVNSQCIWPVNKNKKREKI